MNLTEQQLEYARYRADGNLSRQEAYRKAYPNAKPSSASPLASRLDKKPEIQAEIARLRKATETPLVLSRREKREFLARVVRANLLSIDTDDPNDPNADLIDSKTKKFDKEGNHIGTLVRLPSKASAIEIDNKMAGHNEPEEVDLNLLGGGVMLVPTGGATLDEWEKAAAKQQEQLKRKAAE